MLLSSKTAVIVLQDGARRWHVEDIPANIEYSTRRSNAIGTSSRVDDIVKNRRAGAMNHDRWAGEGTIPPPAARTLAGAGGGDCIVGEVEPSCCRSRCLSAILTSENRLPLSVDDCVVFSDDIVGTEEPEPIPTTNRSNLVVLYIGTAGIYRDSRTFTRALEIVVVNVHICTGVSGDRAALNGCDIVIGDLEIVFCIRDCLQAVDIDSIAVY